MCTCGMVLFTWLEEWEIPISKLCTFKGWAPIYDHGVAQKSKDIHLVYQKFKGKAPYRIVWWAKSKDIR